MEKYKRLETLIKMLERQPFSTKEEILDYFLLHHDVEISTRTLERDFRLLETDFHIPVNYNRSKKGYYLSSEDAEQISSFLSFAGRVYLADLFKKGLQEFEDLQRFVKLEDNSGFSGINYVEPIFLAIQQQRILNFVHENYGRNSFKNHRIAPLQLREYEGRWYVVGIPLNEKNQPENKNIRIFGIERLSQVKTEQVFTFKTKEYEKQLLNFDKIIGLNYDESDKREIIELAVSDQQFKYMVSLPLHPSQVVKGELPDGRTLVSLLLIPNYELKMQILKLGDQVEVLSPQKLRHEIKSILKNNLKNYNDEKKK